MESKAHYALIGTFVLLMFFAGLGFTAWLSGSNLDQNFDNYTVTFEGPIRGIGEASEVRFNGIKVGEVTKVRLDPDDPKQVLVRIEVFEETPVDVESYAQLEAQGLTGLNYIQIFSGGIDLPLAKDTPHKGDYIIPGRRSQIDSLLDGGGSIVESVQKTLNMILETLDGGSTEDFQKIMANIAVITSDYRDAPLSVSRIEATLDIIDQAAKDVSTASLSVDQTSVEARLLLTDQLPPMLAQFKVSLNALDKTLDAARKLADNSSELVITADGSLKGFNAGSLKEIETSAAELKRLLESLNRVAAELERNPTKFLVGEKREIVELPQ